ncbi:arylsulfotransferase [bacterium BMS3Abin03]|nr:arylsulfotransferase [bacterium BMS3Abin03]
MKTFTKTLFIISLYACLSNAQIDSSLYFNDNVSLLYPTMEITKFNNPSEDYLFLGLTSGGSGNLLIVDNELTPVFYRKAEGTVFNFTWQPDGELSYVIYPVFAYGLDSSGVEINRFYTPGGVALDVHDLRVLSDGSYYIIGKELVTVDMSQYVSGGDTAAALITNSVHHMDADDNEMWSWYAIDHYNILDVDQYVDLTQHQIDWTHCNSIEIDTDGNILLSTRNFDEVTKIDRTTGDIIWRLGGEKNQFTFIDDTRGFSRQHSVRRLSNGNLIMFDNGHYLVPEYSSVVEYELDETNLTATLVRRYTRNESVFSQSRGGVQELPNGHILISWGESQNPAVTEINEQDSVEFEMKFVSYAHQYRAYRFKWETNLFAVSPDSIDFGIVAVGDSALAELKLYSTKDSSVTINEFFINDNSFSVLNELPITIPSQDSVTLSVMFKPTAEGYFKDRLNVRSVNDTMLIGKQVYLTGATTLVSVEDRVNSPVQFSLSQNYPNPFNPSTKIKFTIAKSPLPGWDGRGGLQLIKLVVYDLLGNEVTTLINKELPAGNYEIGFNGSNLPSGVYFYRLQAGSYSSTKKLVLLK